MLIISHRGNVDGPDTYAIGYQRRWGVELDLRWDTGAAYFDHTPRGWRAATDAVNILAILEGRTLAVNIKETGHEAEAVALLKQYPDAFVFDMELCGVRPETYRELPRAVRISDRKDERDVNKFEAGIVWLDEFEPWVEERHVKSIKDQGKLIYWVSPELHAPLGSIELEERWQEMIDWGVDGICTDYPRVLELLWEASVPRRRLDQLSEASIG